MTQFDVNFQSTRQAQTVVRSVCRLAAVLVGFFAIIDVAAIATGVVIAGGAGLGWSYLWLAGVGPALTLAFAAALWFRADWFATKLAKPGPLRCVSCKYELSRPIPARCPECGFAILASATPMTKPATADARPRGGW